MSWAKIKENYLGVILGFVSAVMVVWLNPKYSSYISFIQAVPQLTSCIFGFLLALLGIILQGNSPAIKAMKDRTHLYNRFINYNKKVVYLSLFLSVLTMVIGYIDYTLIEVWLVDKCSFLRVLAKDVILFSTTFGIMWLFVDLLTFIKLFYLLITAPDKR